MHRKMLLRRAAGEKYHFSLLHIVTGLWPHSRALSVCWWVSSSRFLFQPCCPAFQSSDWNSTWCPLLSERLSEELKTILTLVVEWNFMETKSHSSHANVEDQVELEKHLCLMHAWKDYWFGLEVSLCFWVVSFALGLFQSIFCSAVSYSQSNIP